MGLTENTLLNALAADKPADASQALRHLENCGLRPPRPDTIGCGTEQRHPGHVATITGKLFDIVNPDARQVDLEDIAHALSLVNRFTGHTPFPYSVAQHSVACAELCYRLYPARPDWQLCCLLHDAAEAYCGDVSRPLKALIRPCYKPIEEKLQAAIWSRFGIEATAAAETVMHTCDQSTVMAEARDMFPGSEAWNWGDTKAAEIATTPMGWKRARRNFLEAFDQLYARSFGKFWESAA